MTDEAPRTNPHTTKPRRRFHVETFLQTSPCARHRFVLCHVNGDASHPSVVVPDEQGERVQRWPHGFAHIVSAFLVPHLKAADADHRTQEQWASAIFFSERCAWR